MRWVAILVVLVGVFPKTSLAQSSSEQEVKSALDQIRQALIHKDTDTLERLYADGFVAVNPDGTIADKADRIKQQSQSQVKIKTLDYSDLKVRVYDTTAIVTGISHATAENRPPHSVRFMQIWIKQDSGWKETALAMTDLKTSESEH
jgi:ketosteroid isomerase-like protein